MAEEENQTDSATPPKKKITFFNSFEEAELHKLQEMAGHTHEERLRNLQILRKRTYSHLLMPDGTWPPLVKILTVKYATYL